MECTECGGACSLYDGGEVYDYKLKVWVCEDCGAWQDEETDGEDEE